MCQITKSVLLCLCLYIDKQTFRFWPHNDKTIQESMNFQIISIKVLCLIHKTAQYWLGSSFRTFLNEGKPNETDEKQVNKETWIEFACKLMPLHVHLNNFNM